MPVNSHFEWRFGGFLQPLGPVFAWSVLAAASIGGLLLVVYLYRRTMRELSSGPRNLLTALRGMLILTILMMLANPSRVHESGRGEPPPAERHLAVLVDRSASMDAADNRNQTRLSNALGIWKHPSNTAAKAFDRIDYQRFGTTVEKAGDLGQATSPGTSSQETRLWTSLQESLADEPAAIVCLTDGIDTTGGTSVEMLADARKRGIPLYFVPATNRSRPAELLSIREVTIPSKVLRQSRFSCSAILEISSVRDREVPVELWSGGRRLADGLLHARAGWNVLPWSAEVSAGEVGMMPLEFRLGTAPEQEISASTTRIIDHRKMEVLYYQGALQWGYRFLNAALSDDPGFHLTGILNPALGVRLKVGDENQATLPDLPDSAAGLAPYQIVVLANVFADQLTAVQQQALADYAKGGGGVLFISPDGQATGLFSGTILEGMLPVVFDRMKPTREELAERKFRDDMDANSAFGDATISEGSSRTQGIPALLPLKIPKGIRGFAKLEQSTPMFCTYSRVRRVKSGAEVLAVHPTEMTGDKTPRVLIARQRFGAGYTAAMATDLLWRWKLSLPNQSRAAETFWQQLLLSLAPDTVGGLRLRKDAGSVEVNRPMEISVSGSRGAAAPQIVSISASGRQEALVAVPSPDGWSASFTPAAEGRWQVAATDSEGNKARITVAAATRQQTIETSNTPADVESMRILAEATGGALIGPGFSFQNAAPPVEVEPVKKIIRPLWNQPWLIALMLGIYAAELITRRKFNLL